jgi:folylpolyglutamate synthase/dihydropteroate synthase
VSDPRRALARARRLAGRDGTVVVAGSLYLVGAILPRRPAARR